MTYLPNEHDLCGDFSFRGTYESAFVDPSVTDPLVYDSSNRQFDVQTANLDLAGLTKTYGVYAEWATYPVAEFD